jgi:LmbE family N-acetylglucosaminyl deacetylase
LSNADQLIDPYLFQNSSTLHQAQFPGAHTQLFKWPIFYLIKLLGFSSSSYIVLTVILVLATIGAFAFILYRIDRRPLVFGTVLLAISSILLLIPAQPYPGGLLPINMGMLSTRNFEYIFYIASLYLIIRSKSFKSWQFLSAILIFSILIASDKLFLTLGLFGGLLALLLYSLIQRWNLVTLAAKWILGSLTAFLLATVYLWFLQAIKLTQIISQTSAGPYGTVKSSHDFLLGVFYSLTGLLTNFGANPAQETTYIRQIPHFAFTNLFGAGGLAYLLNIALLILGLIFTYKIIALTVVKTKSKKHDYDDFQKLVVLLVFSTISAFIVFVSTSHYYAVDARYLTISLFTVVLASVVFLSKKKWPGEYFVGVGILITLMLCLGLVASNRSFAHEAFALSVINHRNDQISDALTHRDGQVLVGDYWRVVPIKFLTNKNLKIMPLSGCASNRVGLSSQAWNYNLNKQGFEYIVTVDRSLTDYKSCNLGEVVSDYGQPNSSTLIDGKLSKPNELVLHYDNGIKQSGPIKRTPALKSATIEPVSLSDLPDKPCGNPTIFTAIAHQDDDLLFMNPDTLHAIQAGYCVRTLYITAGDSGVNNNFYWLGREQGAESAYTNMTGASNIWEERIVKLADNQFVVIANPRGDYKTSLIFMRLPDGNLKGQGFKATNFESLQRLESGSVSYMHSVDGQSKYSSNDLVNAIDMLLHFYQPTEIHTQANYISKTYPDHNDHMAVGRYVNEAYKKYETEQFANQVVIPIKYYIGYPIHAFPVNVSGQDLQLKESAYYAYSKYDVAVCKDNLQCKFDSTFGLYIQRQYQSQN